MPIYIKTGTVFKSQGVLSLDLLQGMFHDSV
jgi:hypothetical protein